MSKFPVASKPLARPSNRLPDGNSSAGLLQLNEQDGDEENSLPASLALLLDYIMSKFPVALKPLAQPSTWRFMSSGLRSLCRSPLRGLPISPDLTMFNSPVHSLSRSLSRDSMRGNRYPRLCPQFQRSWRCIIRLARNGDSVISQRYDLMSSRPSDTRSVPMPVKDAAVLEGTLRSALESYFPVEDDDGFILLSWRLRPDSPGAVAFVATSRGESFLSHMVPSVTKVQKRNLLSDPIFQQEDLFAPATIGAARHAAKDVSLYKGAQSRPSTSSETTQRRPSSSSSASRGHTQSSSAPATPQRSQASSSSKRFTPQK